MDPGIKSAVDAAWAQENPEQGYVIKRNRHFFGIGRVKDFLSKVRLGFTIVFS